MKQYFLLLSLFTIFLSSLEAQQIIVDKDSLKIFGNGDTLYVYNTDNTKLVIDSLYSVNHLYGYWVNIATKDSSFFYFTAYHYENIPLELVLAQNDTAIFFFEMVDLCTICKRNVNNEYFQDTLKLVSNSKLNDTLFLFVEGDALSAVDDNKNLPVEYKLYQNYPNPFNPTTKISYSIKENSFVTIKVYDLLGRVVVQLVNENKPAGFHTVNFDAGRLSSGIYFYTITSNNFFDRKKMILLR